MNQIEFYKNIIFDWFAWLKLTIWQGYFDGWNDLINPNTCVDAKPPWELRCATIHLIMGKASVTKPRWR